VLLVGIYASGTVAMVWMAASRDEVGSRPAQAIVVLGAAQYNGKPSPVLQARLDHALALYRSNLAPLIVVTGGRQAGDRTTEASASAEFLLRKGVPDRRIAREVQGRDTYESMAATARFLKVRRVTDVIVVTDGYHAARVKSIASEVGLKVRVSPVKGTTGSVQRILRESAAYAAGSVVTHRRLSAWLH
jgi:uncharacterized SAM-binding protein YcdF (DUF218 family)